MAIARSRGKLRGKLLKLSPAQTREVHRMHASGDYAIAQIAELFSVSPAHHLPIPAAHHGRGGTAR